MFDNRSALSRVSLFAVVAIFSGLVIAAGLIPANEARAATITVDTNNDELEFTGGPGDCSLREAIVSANDNVAVDGCEVGSQIDTDVISLPAATYNLVIPGEGENAAGTGDLDITEDLIIQVVAPPTVSVQGQFVATINAGGTVDPSSGCFANGSGSAPQGTAGSSGIDRVLHVLPPAQASSSGPAGPQGTQPLVSLTLSDLTISGGNADESGTPGGGGILADQSALNLDDVNVRQNVAFSQQPFTGVEGGGIALIGGSTLDMIDSIVEDNVVYGFLGDGGGISSGGGQITAADSAQEFASNVADSRADVSSEALGDPIPDVTIDNSQINTNLACGLFAFGGGASLLGVPQLTDTDFDGNRAEAASVASGGGVDLGFSLLGGPNTISKLDGGTISNNQAISFGDDSFVNPIATGGGIGAGGDTTLTRLSVENNTAFAEESTETAPISSGGGIAHSSGPLSLSRSTVNGNLASAVEPAPTETTSTGDGAAEGPGGTQENGNAFGGGVSLNNSTGTVENTTISDNTAFGGSGVFVFSQGGTNSAQGSSTQGTPPGPSTDIDFSTVTDNTSEAGEGAGLYTNGSNDPGEVHLFASIIAEQQTGFDCLDDSESNMIQDDGENLDSDGTCTDDASSETADPLLEDLGDNGGDTLTHALNPNSPAIDEVDEKDCPPEDQRGEARPQDGDGVPGALCDRGAFEFKTHRPFFCPGFASDPRPQIVGTAAPNTLNGTGAAEIICGQGGGDTINGNGGNDLILGGPGQDTLRGNAGNDKIEGAGKNDTILGGTGDDRLRGFNGDDDLSGEEGEDRITGGTDLDTISGGPDDDKLFGWSENDSLNGNTGADLVFGSLGDDVLDGGGGPDRVRGFFGDDDLFGRAGSDVLIGMNGDDDLDGGADTDTCFGGSGTNTFTNCP